LLGAQLLKRFVSEADGAQTTANELHAVICINDLLKDRETAFVSGPTLFAPFVNGSQHYPDYSA
jgi:hypothetical protein